MKQYIVGLGEALWDCLPEGKKIGGAPANFAFHAGQFGHDSIAISAIGNDKLGEETLAEFDKKHVNYLMPVVDYPTGTVQVTLDEAGVPTYEIKEGVAWDNIPFTSEIEEVAKNCRAVCFGSLAHRKFISAVRTGHRLPGNIYYRKRHLIQYPFRQTASKCSGTNSCQPRLAFRCKYGRCYGR